MRTKLGESEKNFLLKLARDTIKSAIQENNDVQLEKDEIPPALNSLAATFVTLTQKGELRGCIGKLTAVQPMYKDVIENAYSAAFNDPRFPPLTKSELPDTRIEISILTEPVELKYKDTNDLLNVLSQEKCGVVIEKEYHHSTFLPQVWDELQSSAEFLSHLCAKAGLDPNEWKTGDLTVKTYTVNKFCET